MQNGSAVGNGHHAPGGLGGACVHAAVCAGVPPICALENTAIHGPLAAGMGGTRAPASFQHTRAPQPPRRVPNSFRALKFSQLPTFPASRYSGLLNTPPEGPFRRIDRRTTLFCVPRKCIPGRLEVFAALNSWFRANLTPAAGASGGPPPLGQARFSGPSRRRGESPKRLAIQRRKLCKILLANRATRLSSSPTASSRANSSRRGSSAVASAVRASSRI